MREIVIKFTFKFPFVSRQTYSSALHEYQSVAQRIAVCKYELKEYKKRCKEMSLKSVLLNVNTYAMLQRRRYLTYRSYRRLVKRQKQLELVMERIIRRGKSLGGSMDNMNAANTPKRRKTMEESDVSMSDVSSNQDFASQTSLLSVENGSLSSQTSSRRWQQHRLKRSPSKVAADRLLNTTKKRIQRNEKALATQKVSTPRKKIIENEIKKDKQLLSQIKSRRSSFAGPDAHVAKKKGCSSRASSPAQQVSELIASLDQPTTPQIARRMRQITLDATTPTTVSQPASDQTSNRRRKMCYVQPAASQPALQGSVENAMLNEPCTPASQVTLNISSPKTRNQLDTSLTPKTTPKCPATPQSESVRERNRIKNRRYREKQIAMDPDFRKNRALSSQQSYRRKSDVNRATRLAQMLRYARANQSKSKKTRQCRRLINRGLAVFNRLAALAPKNDEESSIGQLCQRLRHLQPGKRYRHVIQKYIRLQQRQNEAKKLDVLLNEIAKDISNPTFQKPEYAQLMLLGKKVATIKCPDDLTAHVNFIDEAFRKMRAMKEATTTILGKTLTQLQKQITANVKRHPGINDDEYVRCQLLRLPFHVKQRSESNEGYTSMQDLLPKIHHETLTGQPIPTLTPQIDPTIDTTLIDGMAPDVVEGFVFNPNLNDEDEEDGHVESAVNNEPMDADMRAILDQALADEIDDPEALNDPIKPLMLAVLRHTTMIKECTERCPDVMSTDEARVAMSTMLEIIKTPPELLRRHHLMQRVPGLPCGILQFIRNQSPCASGCRTILKRLMTIRRYVDFLAKLRNCVRDADEETMRELCAFRGVPVAIENAIAADFEDDEDENILTEGHAMKHYGHLVDKCRAAFAELEVHPCDICDELKLERELQRIEADKVLLEARAHRTQPKYVVCLSCRRQMKDGKLPIGAISNAFDIEECPAELKNLNWLEKALIQKVRPVQNLVTLTDKAGRKTKVIATRGALVVLPVPTNGTMKHVAQTLPSAANLNIIVKTDHGRRIVSLPRVLRALRWLKANNDLYKDIEIDEQFRFSLNGVHFDKAAPTQADCDALIEFNDAAVNTILQHDDIQHQPIMNTNDADPDGTSFEQYTLKKSPWKPFNVHDPTLDVGAFPWLFPYGTKGANDATRPRKPRFREFIRHLLALKHRRFATDSQWLCFCQGLLQQMDLLGSMGISARMNKGNLTSADILKYIQNEDPEFQKCLASNTASLRCHQPYWNKIRKKVKAHTRIFKAPTMFLTLNPSLPDWTEVHEAYSKVHGVPVDKTNIADFVAKDPYIWTRHFQHRLRSLMELMLKKKDGPLGEITHFFYRIEYQARGTEHVHMLIWLKDAPKADDTEEKIVDFINRHITARLPDPVKEPLLHGLVDRLQRHNKNCTNTCKRLVKYQGRVSQRCRFEFPRKASRRTVINKNREPLLGIRTATTKYYTLRRRKNRDEHINDYNPAILLAWRGNIDLQFISPDSIDIINYVTGYTTKNESGKKNSLLQECLNDEMDKTALFQTLLGFMKQRETGVMEIVDWLNGHHMFEFDVSHVNVNSNMPEDRFRIMKKRADLKDDASSGVKDNIADVYYPQRAAALEDVSIFTMIINFVIRAKLPKDCPIEKWAEEPAQAAKDNGPKLPLFPLDDINDDDDFDLPPPADKGPDDNSEDEAYESGFADSRQNNPFDWDFHTSVPESPFYCFPKLPKGTCFTTGVPHMVFSKCRAHVPMIFWPHLEDDNEKAREDYFRRLCFMFIPWRDESNLKGDFDSYEERWERFYDALLKKSPAAHADIAKVIDNVKAQLESDREVFRRRAKLRQAKIDEGFDYAAQDESLSFDREVDVDEFAKHVESFNAGQREIFDHVMASLDAQATNPATPPLHLFVSGTAGTGKTHLIKGLADAVTVKYVNSTSPQAAVIIGAPTGLAAIQIGGATLHRLFSLSVQHSGNSGWNKLDVKRLNYYRVMFANVKLIIIDEISMCSNVSLLSIHRRLGEIFGTDEADPPVFGTFNPKCTFGGRNIICFGDLLQLPPVLAPKVFKCLSTDLAKKYFGTFIGINMWKLFEYRELTENMRQKGDLVFAELMGRLRTEQMTAEDHEMLQKRIIPSSAGGQASLKELVQYFLTLQKDAPTSMALFPTRTEVQVFNMEVAKLLELTVIRIPAEDSEPTTPHRKSKAAPRRPDRTKELQVVVPDKKPGVSRKRVRWEDNYDENDGRKSGGLEKDLAVAVGCRIMLTRNIPMSSSLVNGSTGVLLDIVFDATDGTSKQPKALSMVIQFDRLPKPVTLGPESSTFDVGFDKQVTRRQFPVIMAYAATIHKSQGLTLPHALISTVKIFAPGQAFVGFSRVTNINGLHLADYDPSKMFADAESLAEYNLLRGTINLPAFPMPKPRPKPSPPTVGTPVVPSNTASDGTISAVAPVSVAAVAVPPVSMAAAAVPPVNDGFFRLRNVAQDCFVIAAVNALHACSALVDNIVHHPYQGDGLMQQLKALYDDPQAATTVRAFRALTSSAGNDQGDPEDVFANIFDAMTDEQRALFTFRRTRFQRCGCFNGHKRRLGEPQFRTELRVNLTNVEAPAITFAEALETTASFTEGTCEVCGQHRIRWKEFSPGPQQRYLKLHIIHPLNELGHLNPVQITAHKSSAERIIRARWNLISAVEYHPGHYTSIRRVANNDWVIQNDHQVSHRSRINKYLARYTALFYEKVD